MYTAESDVPCFLLIRCHLAQLERITTKIADFNDLRALVMVRQDHELITEIGFNTQDLVIEFANARLIDRT